MALTDDIAFLRSYAAVDPLKDDYASWSQALLDAIARYPIAPAVREVIEEGQAWR